MVVAKVYKGSKVVEFGLAIGLFLVETGVACYLYPALATFWWLSPLGGAL